MIHDVLIFSKNQEEHDKHLTVALGKIQSWADFNKDKCQFSKNRITFLGRIIDGSGDHPDSDKVSAIRKIITPQNM